MCCVATYNKLHFILIFIISSSSILTRYLSQAIRINTKMVELFGIYNFAAMW